LLLLLSYFNSSNNIITMRTFLDLRHTTNLAVGKAAAANCGSASASHRSRSNNHRIEAPPPSRALQLKF
jgi:hypothetical protein